MQNEQQHKIAFYPCCARDVEEPRRLLAPFVDEIIFCDIQSFQKWGGCRESADLPTARFIQGDVREVIPTLPEITVLFYRRDSDGEGGSSIYILGRRILPQILARFPDAGGLIITDGSNSRSGMFRKMSRPDGYIRKPWNCTFRPSSDQPFLTSHRLHMLEITKNNFS